MDARTAKRSASCIGFDTRVSLRSVARLGATAIWPPRRRQDAHAFQSVRPAFPRRRSSPCSPDQALRQQLHRCASGSAVRRDRCRDGPLRTERFRRPIGSSARQPQDRRRAPPAGHQVPGHRARLTEASLASRSPSSVPGRGCADDIADRIGRADPVGHPVRQRGGERQPTGHRHEQQSFRPVRGEAGQPGHRARPHEIGVDDEGVEAGALHPGAQSRRCCASSAVERQLLRVPFHQAAAHDSTRSARNAEKLARGFSQDLAPVSSDDDCVAEDE